MFFRYGSYQHSPNEVTLANFRIYPVRNAKQIRIGTQYSMHLEGELYVQDGLTNKDACQADLTNKINLLINAYKDDFKDAGFYQDNGTPTPHILPTNHPDNLTGNIVTHRNWPMGDGNEYATKRTYSIGISALFKNAYSQIVSYEDHLTQEGDGGSIINWYNRRFGPPGFQVLHDKSYVKYTHTGSMTVTSSYPIPPQPFFSRPYLLGHMTKITRSSPIRYSQGYTNYGVSWSYTYVLPSAAFLLPTTR